MSFERGFLTKPAVKRELAAWPPQNDGPRQCCAEYAIVTDCDGVIDHLHCGVCEYRWERPCSEADLVAHA